MDKGLLYQSLTKFSLGVIFLMLDGQLPKQVAVPRAEIKEKLEIIYKELGIKKAAKATDLNT